MITLGSLDFLDGSRVLITGGTGSLGKMLTSILLRKSNVATVVIYSRDEFKQFHMRNMFTAEDQKRLRFFIGNVRDERRLMRAMDQVDYVIHAAALKQIPAAEYNPFEFIKTNVMGAQNVIDAALDNNVKNVVALSTDKAANPINLYGATKLCSDKLFITANNFRGQHRTKFSVVRYGNVVGSRGSVIPFFLKKYKDGVLPVTDNEMTRFWITMEQGAALVLNALCVMVGREIWVPKIPSMTIHDLAEVIGPNCKQEIVGIRPGEKLHEVMIPKDKGACTLEFEDHFVMTPSGSKQTYNYYLHEGGKPCEHHFYFGSDNNKRWLTKDELIQMIASLDIPEAKEWIANH